MNVRGDSGTMQPKLIFLAFIAATILVAAMVWVILDPLSETDEKLDPLLPESRSSGDEEVTPIDKVEGDSDRNRLLPAGPEGEKVQVDGRITIDGSPLAGTKIQAFVDLPSTLPPNLANNIKASPIFYSALAADLKEIIREYDLFQPPEGHRRFPSDESTSKKDGSFSLSVLGT